MLARVICGREAEPYGGSIPYSQLKVSGVDVFSAGVISGKVLKRPFSITMPYAAHTKVTMRKGRVTGAVLFGNTNEGSSLLALVQGAAVSELIPSESGGLSALNQRRGAPGT